jgi:hypothetical protein
MARKVVFLLALAGSLAAASARAQDEAVPAARPSDGREIDAGLAWIDHPPPLTLYTPGRGGTRIGGLPDDFVKGNAPLYTFQIHTSFTITPPGPLVFPVFGMGIGFGAGGYPDSTTSGDVVYRNSGAAGFATLELSGIGLRAATRDLRVLVSVVPALDLFWASGHVSDPSLDFDASGTGKAFALRARGEVCARSGDGWLCAYAGTSVVEGWSFLNGGFVGLERAF